jgi:hypothetical protein
VGLLPGGGGGGGEPREPVLLGRACTVLRIEVRRAVRVKVTLFCRIARRVNLKISFYN